MNFSKINKIFGASVHIWGACAYRDQLGQIVVKFIPVKRLEAYPLATEFHIVAQDRNGDGKLSTKWIKIEDIFNV